MKNLFIYSVVCLYVMAALGAAMAQGTAEQTVFEIQSRWDQKRYLTVDGAQLLAGAATVEQSRWILEPLRGGYAIRHQSSGKYLQLQSDSDELTLNASAPADDRGRWLVDPIDPYVSIRNAATGRFLNIENLEKPVNAGLSKKPDAKNWWSGLWKLNHVAGPKPARMFKEGQVVVTSPEYGATITGDTKFEFIAPGLTQAMVKSWLPGGRFGEDSVVAEVKLDDSGRGSFVFPAARYPHGPITVRILGTDGKRKNNNYFMVFNTSGVKWNAGLPDAPPQAKGMKLLFADDFADSKLSISKDGKGTTYASHKIGGGDFSGIPFANHEDAQKTPFSQVGTYLRIRADRDKNTTGLIASIGEDGKGITAMAPCYFECRFIAQSAPGTWPAFWVMTNYMLKNEGKPLSRPADELDVIEAYGGEGPGTPNAPGYMLIAHYWNQAPDGKKDYTQDRFSGPIHMTKLPGGGGASWYETFHTYGVLVGLEDTIYYCDDIEVARHKTARLSRAEPLFFYVNLAIGGASGWKIDLSQYDGLADMYVDYVRVYQGDRPQ